MKNSNSKDSNKLRVTSNELEDKDKKSSDPLLVTAVLLFVTCYCLLSAGISESADQGNLMDDVKKAIAAELANTVSENVELGSVRIIKGADVVKEGARYVVKDVSMSGYNGRNKAVFTAALSDEKSVQRDITVEASYDVMVDVLVAARALAAGSALSDGDYYVIRQRSSKTPQGALSQRKDTEGKVLRTGIGQGVILRADYLTAQANIKRGQKVNVVVEGGSVVISTHGQLRNDAIVGGSAKVLCENSKKEVIGILVSPNTVKVGI